MKGIVRENIKKVSERGERLDNLEEQAGQSPYLLDRVIVNILSLQGLNTQ